MAGPGRRLGVTALVLLAWLGAAAPADSVFTGLTTNPGNSFAAASGFCDGATPIWLTGFESGVISSAGASVTPASSLLNSVTANTTAEPASVRSGSFALRVNKVASASHYVGKTNLGGGTVVTMRLAIRFGSLPTANQTELAKIDITTGADVVLGYNNTVPKRLTLGYSGGTLQSGPTGAVVAGVWYRIDLRVNVAANPHTIDWQVDGVDQTQATIAQAADTFAGNINLGSTVSADVFNAYYDDVLVSATSADYPIGDGRIAQLVPNVYVGKTDPSDYLKETNGTTNLSATSYGVVNETPANSISPILYVQQTTGHASDYFAEFGFEDVTRTACLNGVSAVATLHSASTSANNVRTAIRTGGTDRLVHSGDSVATTTMQYRSAVVASIDGSWDATELTAATARIGYRRVGGSTPYWDSVRLEYDQVPNAASGYANTVLADSPASYWRFGDSGGTPAAGAVTGTGSYFLAGGGVGDTDNAFYLDGSGTSVTFGDVYDFAGTASFTVEAWIRPLTNGVGEAAGYAIVNKRDPYAIPTQGWSLGVGPSHYPGSPWFHREAGGAGPSSALSLYRWHHIAATYDGSNLRLYANGALLQTVATTAAVTNTTLPLVVGLHEDPSYGPIYFRGGVDEVAIYTTALSGTRIQAHYDAGKR